MTVFADDRQLDALLRASDPVDADAVRTASTSAGAAALADAISQPATAAGPRLRTLRRPVVLAAVAAIATAIPLSLTLVHPSSNDSAYGAALVRFAEHSPQLLVGIDGWRVTRADEENEQTGEMDFASGTQTLELYWVGGANSKDSDKADMTHLGSAQIDGAQAWVGTYGGRDFEAIWSVGDRALDARGVFPSEAAFLAIATTLHRVDVDTWLDAMPASVVDPASRAAVIEQMLADVPQPTGFDISKLDSGPGVTDRYQLGAQVVGAVSCAWIHQWAHGTPDQRAQAAQAMASSHHWAILKQMQSEGAYPDVVWEIADAMNGKPLTITPGQTLEQWAQPALGC